MGRRLLINLVLVPGVVINSLFLGIMGYVTYAQVKEYPTESLYSFLALLAYTVFLFWSIKSLCFRFLDLETPPVQMALSLLGILVICYGPILALFLVSLRQP